VAILRRMSVPDEFVPGLHSSADPASSGELARRLLAAMDEGVLVFDQDGTPIMANAAAIEITGVTFEAPEGALATAGEPAVWEQLLELLPGALSGRERGLIEGSGRRGDGSEFPFEAEVLAMEVDRRQVFVTFVHDVSDRKAAERRLADARDAALRASAVKSEFLATMSHEIRTPMNGVIGSLDLMLDSELAPELVELAQIARTAANDLLAIIDDILDLSKIEADKVESRRESLDLVAIVEGVADIVAATARQKGVGLVAYVDPEIPQGVLGDARLLRQILVNLAGNAVKFTDAGEVVIRAERQAAPSPQALVRFTVSDTGVGIPADAIETLFEPFTQFDPRSTHERGGTGLGLAISSRLVRLMGGRLAVDSELGRGSVFSFELPFELTDEVLAAPPAPPPAGRPLRVLVIDGSPASADAVARYLRTWGMVATSVSDAAAGTERFAAAPVGERFDVVLVASGALGGDHQELARALRALAGEEGVSLIELLEIGEQRADGDDDATGGYDAAVSKPLKQARLYAALAAVGPQRGSVGHDEVPEASAALRGLRVLIAEDNPVNKEVLLRQVQRLGLLADAVTNGQEVLDALAEGSYDAVLMDCQMPVMDGYTATRAIRSLEQGSGRHLPIVAVTANAMRDDYDRCVQSGMDDFVAKPVTLSALAGAIDRAVQSAGGEGAEETPAPGAGAGATGEGAASAPDAGDRAAALSAAIDRAALDSLSEDLGGAAALLRIVRLFLEQLAPQADQIEHEARSGELETLGRNAHRMKSSAATLGAVELAELLAQLEAAAVAGETASCLRLGERFAAAVPIARAAFEALVEELDAQVAAEG
jgi:two-component system, sensor histidine kinase and response regulator